MAFEFLDTAGLTDGEVTLRLEKTAPADPAKNYVPAYHFLICRAEDGAKAGRIDLRVGHNENLWYGGNIGYEVDEAHRGHHYAEKACRLLFGLAARHGMGYVIITCSPENGASRRTCERLGGRLAAIADLPPHNEMYAAGARQKCIFRYEVGAAAP